MKVPDETIRIEVKVSDLAITEHMIWLGADVKLGAKPRPTGPAQKDTPSETTVKWSSRPGLKR
jgi:hypothetical protein